MSVCLLAYLKNDDTSKHRDIFRSCMLPVAVARSFADDNAMRCVYFRICGRRYVWLRLCIVKVNHQGAAQHRGQSQDAHDCVVTRSRPKSETEDRSNKGCRECSLDVSVACIRRYVMVEVESDLQGASSGC